MKIAYLLDRPELGGGVKVVFQHATLLAARGHQVQVAGRGPEPPWTRELPGRMPGFEPRYLDLSHQAPGAVPDLPEPVDLLLATYWTTLLPAVEATGRRAVLGAAAPPDPHPGDGARRDRSGGDRPAVPPQVLPEPSEAAGRPVARAAAHLCQGFEPDWPHQRQNAAEIEAAYRAAGLPALVVSPHLGQRLEERFGLPWRVVAPPIDERFRPRWRAWSRPRRRPWIAVQGIFQAEVKGVPTALEAVRLLADRGLRPRLLRISVLPPTEEERRLRPADRFLHGVSPERVAEALRRCDLALFPARLGEGFGLPLLEALASGVPAVASRIPPTEAMTGGAVPLVPPGDAEALADAAAEILGSARAWRRARAAGLRAVRRFATPDVATALDTAVSWAFGEADRPATARSSPSATEVTAAGTSASPGEHRGDPADPPSVQRPRGEASG